jgi:copper chaperone
MSEHSFYVSITAMQKELMNITTCGGCANQLIHALQVVDGVQKVNISAGDGKATVKFDERLTSPEQLKAALRHAGFGVEPDTATASKGCCCG